MCNSYLGMPRARSEDYSEKGIEGVPMKYDYRPGDICKVTFFKDRKAEIDHVWVCRDAESSTLAFLHGCGFQTEIGGAVAGAVGHTEESMKRYLTQRIANDWS